jgi:hypothetical protein
MRSRSQKPLNASISDVEGVMGYQAPIVAPAYTQPRAAAVLPSMIMCPRVASIFSTRNGNGQEKFARA